MSRPVTALFGVVFLGAAIAVAVKVGADLDVSAVLAVLILGSLGVDALVAAVRKRRSLLSRIGPLP
jgi:hypothetical protein